MISSRLVVAFICELMRHNKFAVLLLMFPFHEEDNRGDSTGATASALAFSLYSFIYFDHVKASEQSYFSPSFFAYF